MPSEQQTEVYRQHRTAQEKYTYFLLAAVGAAIALVVNQTQDVGLAYSQVPLAIGVASWGLSFYFGCKHLAYTESVLFANATLLQAEAGEHPEVGNHPQVIEAASQGIRAAIKDNSRCAVRYARWQFRCLVLGAIAYLFWHVLEMWLRSGVA